MNTRLQYITDNISRIKENIMNVCNTIGKDSSSVKLMAVSKTMPVDDVKIAIEAGVKIIGENIVQEANEKYSVLKTIIEENTVNFCFIGHLQSNKAKIAAKIFQSIDTVDRIKIAKKLQEYACEEKKIIDCMVQINIGYEDSKFGIAKHEIKNLITEITQMNNLRIRGFFAVPPYFDDPESSRPFFRQMRILRDNMQLEFPHIDLKEISMGMSHDYSVAIEEGATMIRVGQGIFGPRSLKI